MNNKKAIAILGGMGPEASMYMYDLLIKLSIRDYGAKNNNDFPEIILHSVPVPDFISSDKDKDKALHMLKERVRCLSSLTISSISIACNTAHVLLPELIKVSNIHFISMIDEVINKINKDEKRKVGLLGTPSTIRSKMYQKGLRKLGIETISPVSGEFGIIESVIRNVISGKTSTKDETTLVRIADYLKEKGAEGIILGCTELPLVFPKNYSLPVYNSVEILANVLLEKYYKGKSHV